MSEDFINQDLETLMKEGKEALENDDLDKADKLLHQALELDPNNADLHVDLGRVFVKLKKTVEAREHYQKALELDPNSFRPLQALGRLEANLGNHENALKLFLNALELKPKAEECADINVDIGNLYFSFSQFEMAQDYYNLAIEQNPNCARAFNNLGNVAFKQDKRAESLEFYKKAVSLDDKNDLFKKNLARGYFYEGIYDKAETLFLGILAADNDEAIILYLGKCFYYSKKYEKAIDTLTSLISKTSDSYLLFYAHEYSGKAYTQLNQLDEALVEWSLSLNYFEHSNVYKEIGRLKGLQCKFIEALEYFEKALYFPSKDKDFSNLFDLIWHCTATLKDDGFEEHSKKCLEIAIRILEHFTEKYPGIAEAHYYLAILYPRLKQEKKANICARKAYDIDAKLLYLYQLIMSDLRLKKLKTAEVLFELYLERLHEIKDADIIEIEISNILKTSKQNFNKDIELKFRNKLLEKNIKGDFNAAQ